MTLILLKLLKRKESWIIVIILILALLLASSRGEVQRLRTALDARPTIEAKAETATDKKEVRGIVITKEVTRTEPSGVIIVTKEITEQPVVTLTVTKAVVERHETPTSCPKARQPPRYFAGLMTNPGNIRGDVSPRLGINIGGRVDLAWSKTLSGGLMDGHRIDAAWRFGK